MNKLLLLICCPLAIFCQNTIGLPDVVNYSKQTYSAGLQNWDIKQDKNGIIYVANNEGLLSFDGKNWNLYPLPNKTIVRSVEISSDNKIYVGGQDEIGYFTPSQNGLLQYTSLSQLISVKDKNFGDVWDIVEFNKSIFFRSLNRIFQFNNQSFASFKTPNEWSFLGICNGNLYAQDNKTGVMNFTNNAWQPLFTTNPLSSNNTITGILPIQKDSALITTLKNGVFVLSKNAITPLQTANNELFKTDRIYAATNIPTLFCIWQQTNQRAFSFSFKRKYCSISAAWKKERNWDGL